MNKQVRKIERAHLSVFFNKREVALNSIKRWPWYYFRTVANSSFFKSFINSQEVGRFCLQDCTMIQLDTVYNLQGQYKVKSPIWFNSENQPLQLESVDIDVRLDR